MIEETLRQLGLTQDAAMLYRRLLEDGASTGGALAKVTGLARATVYDGLGRLADHGLVRQSLARGVKQYAAEPPDRISHLFEKKLQILSGAKQAYDAMLPMLEARRASHFVAPHFQMFDGPEAVKNILNDILLYSGLATRSFWPIAAAVETLSGEFFRQHNQQRVENGISVKAIWPQRRTVDLAEHPYLGSGPAHLREIRIAPRGIDFTMGYWIYGTRVAFLSSKSEAIGFIIESREMVEMMGVQHEILWKLSTPLKSG